MRTFLLTHIPSALISRLLKAENPEAGLPVHVRTVPAKQNTAKKQNPPSRPVRFIRNASLLAQPGG